jgi:hypothetical protein
LEKTRENVAMLQTRLEAELRKATAPAGPAPVPAAGAGPQPEAPLQYASPAPGPIAESPDAVGRLQKLSRDARRRAMGG